MATDKVDLAIIGGSGLDKIDNLENITQHKLDTPYGKPSAAFIRGHLADKSIIFLARHGNSHNIAPNKINYRANIWGLKQLGVDKIIAVAAVGGITKNMPPKSIVLPDQIIDYSYNREQSFFDGNIEPIKHIDFSYPYNKSLRLALARAADSVDIKITAEGVYGCCQGPRLETAAEIKRMQKDGCNLVGMTAMPEAVLAREIGINYATCAVVTNWAAGITATAITMETIIKNLNTGIENVKKILEFYCKQTSSN